MSDEPTCSRNLRANMAQQSAGDVSLLPLEAYLASATLMHPIRICNFLRIVEQIDKKKDKEFIKRLDKEARNQGILGNDGNWKFELDENDGTNTRSAPEKDDQTFFRKYSHSYYLTTEYKMIGWGNQTTPDTNTKEEYIMQKLRENPDEIETRTRLRENPEETERRLRHLANKQLEQFTTSVFELLKVMRNNYVHFNDYPPGIKEALGWGSKIQGKVALSDSLFINYWSLRFPKLFSFIWKEFYQLKEQFQQLSTYYPLEVTMHMPELDLTLPGFVTNLKTKLQGHLEERGLISYYINDAKNMRLEFHHLSSALHRVAPYEDLSEVYVRLSNQGVETVFRKEEEISVRYDFPSDQKSLAIMVKRLTGSGLESNFLKQCVDCEKIVVLLLKPEDEGKVLSDIEFVCRLKFRPVLWKDLDESEKSILLNRSVKVHDIEYKLVSILPEDESQREGILSSLDEKELRNLFQNSVPKLYSKCIKPKLDEFYIERRIVQENNSLEVEQEQLNNGVRENVWIESTHANLLFLCDKPGQGKTTFTSSFANKTSKFLVLHLTAEKLALQLNRRGESNVIRESILDAFNTIFCSTYFEKSLLESLLTANVKNKKVLILIDALDEAGSEAVEPILKTLLIIRNDFPTAQVLVTMRVHLINQTIEQITGGTYYRLESFSDEDKIQYLTQYLNSHVERYTESTNIPVPTQEELTEFAKKCIKIEVSEEFQDVLGVPLQCRIIAEIYAENVLNRNFSVQDFGNVPKYFEKYFDSKCQIYFREKQKMPGDNLVNSPLFKRTMTDMLTIHTYYTLKFFHGDHFCVVLFKDKFLPLFDKNTETDSLNFGIIKTLEPLEFMHLLLAEYLVARFYKEFAKQDGIYHSLFTEYGQKYKWEFNSMLGQYVPGLARYHEIMHEPCFEFQRPTVFKFLKYLSEDQSNSVVNPVHVYPMFSYYLKKFSFKDYPDRMSLYHNTVSSECERELNQIVGDYLTDSTRLGKLIHRQGFKLFPPTVIEFLRYLSELSNPEVNSDRIFPHICLYDLQNVALQDYQQILPEFVYTKIIEMLNVIQRLWSTLKFCRIIIHVIEDDARDCEIHVHVQHINTHTSIVDKRVKYP